MSAFYSTASLGAFMASLVGLGLVINNEHTKTTKPYLMSVQLLKKSEVLKESFGNISIGWWVRSYRKRGKFYMSYSFSGRETSGRVYVASEISRHKTEITDMYLVSFTPVPGKVHRLITEENRPKLPSFLHEAEVTTEEEKKEAEKYFGIPLDDKLYTEIHKKKEPNEEKEDSSNESALL